MTSYASDYAPQLVTVKIFNANARIRRRSAQSTMGAMAVDETKLNEFLGKAVGDLGAAMSATLILVGDRLGLYRELARAL